LRAQPIRELVALVQRMLLMRKELRSREASVVHVICAPNLSGLLMTRERRTGKLVWSVHEELRNSLGGRLLAGVVSFSSAAAVVCVSDWLRGQLVSQARRRAKVVYSGTSLIDSPGSDEFVWPFRSESSALKLACVGRINAWKGHEYLLMAVAQLLQLGVSVELVIAGTAYRDGSEMRRLRSLADRLQISNSVAWVGEVRPGWSVFEAADVAVIPSAEPEPFGKVVIEAMLLGRQVVATNQGGPKEIITHGRDGYLVARRDSVALAERIIFINENRDLWLSVGNAAKSRAACFSAENCASEYMSIYESLA
jgi:glycosyltransferase involved in cell wall biosynthesis